ncbi:MAG TPA: prolyl oligopeptidase family serine peptidase [Chloroflexota bacterium]
MNEPPIEEIEPRLVYVTPGMDRVPVEKDIVYKTAEDTELRADVYQPPDRPMGERLPAVIFIHGDGPTEMLRDIKDSGQYVPWAQVTALTGLVAVTFNHRSSERGTELPEAASDIDDLVTYIRNHADRLGIDAHRLCVWTCSAGPPVGLRSILRDRPGWVRCIVIHYGVMDLQPERARLPETVSDETLREFSPISYLGNDVDLPPMLISRAGLDRPELNASLERFVARAVATGVSLDYLNHPTGHHAFDIVDDVPRSHAIIRRTLTFMKEHA